MQTKLIVKEAVERGYTHWAYESDEPAMREISKIKPEDFEDNRRILLVNPKGYKYTIAAKTIEELVADYLVAQDEVADEDCELCDLAAEADYESLANDINQRMSKKTWFDMTAIELIP